MPRAWVWIQLIIGWMPIWALFSVLIMAAHQLPAGESVLIALRMMMLAALLGLLVHRMTARLPWPHPFRLHFIAAHLLAAALYASTWVLLNSVIESMLRGQWVAVLGPGLVPYLITGVWLYVMVAGVAYATRAAERTAQIAAVEARSQLAALRAQLHPHFLFNALHTVVQLIPVDPRGAVRAAEHLADALRTVIEEQRDLVPLADEWAFVQRYLTIEGIRFGERLQVNATLDPAAMQATLPPFSLQTLIENAVRHAAAPRIQRTTIEFIAQMRANVLELSVTDDGPGADPEQIANAPGTGLRRLRERLGWLYGSGAQLTLGNAAQNGFRVQLHIPQVESRLGSIHAQADDDD